MMLINEVESIVGLSKKSIRYYEQVGLFRPKRQNNNDYREFTESDIATLKKIKFLRDLDISITEIKKLNNGDLSLKECIQDKIKKLEQQEQNYIEVKKICKDILLEETNYNNLNIDKYSKKINILNQGGFIMRDLKEDQTKKINGAIISSIVFIIFFIFFAGLITYFQLTETEKMPMALYIFFIAMFIIPTISVIINLITRIKEIKGGEEDEASKY